MSFNVNNMQTTEGLNMDMEAMEGASCDVKIMKDKSLNMKTRNGISYETVEGVSYKHCLNEEDRDGMSDRDGDLEGEGEGEHAYSEYREAQQLESSFEIVITSNRQLLEGIRGIFTFLVLYDHFHNPGSFIFILLLCYHLFLMRL